MPLILSCAMCSRFVGLCRADASLGEISQRVRSQESVAYVYSKKLVIFRVVVALVSSEFKLKCSFISHQAKSKKQRQCKFFTALSGSDGKSSTWVGKPVIEELNGL